MKHTAKLSGLAFASLLAVAPMAAHAAPVISFNGSTGTYGNAPGSTIKFIDNYSFSVPKAGRLTVTLSSTQTGPYTNVNFNYTYAQLNGTKLNIISTGINEFRQLINIPVVAGVQNLLISGASQRLGSYSGTLSFSVPEPATWAMLTLGFGAIAFGMRRRRPVVAAKFA